MGGYKIEKACLLEVKEEMKDFVDIQLVAFPQEGFLSYSDGTELVEEALKLGADVVGRTFLTMNVRVKTAWSR